MPFWNKRTSAICDSKQPWERALRCAALSLLLAGPAEGGGGWETAGWHLLRPGESPRSIALRYLGGESAARRLLERNPQLPRLRPGDRVQVPLDSGLPPGSALLSVIGGRVDARPNPVPWLPGRRFDLLTEGDGLRTYSTASAELLFADTTRLLISEESLVFLRNGTAERVRSLPGEVEIVDGQIDLNTGIRRWPDDSSIEIVMGEARAHPKSNTSGDVSTRARRLADGSAQIMVYRGSSELEASGIRVQMPAGTGSLVPAGGAPSPPERLLPPPSLLTPATDGEAAEPIRLRWTPVPGAASYTVELCADSTCSHLLARRTGLRETSHAIGDVAALAGGTTYWRVTAVASSTLDGFPSPSAELNIEGGATPPMRSAAGGTIFGSVRSESAVTPLPGVRVRLVEAGIETRSAADGAFDLEGIDPGLYTLEALVDGIVIGRLEEVEVEAGRPVQVVLLSDPGLMAHDEIVVRPSRVTLLEQDSVAAVALGQDEIRSLPQLGDDVFRTLPVLPGLTANDVSAQFHVRGSRRDEVHTLLDGQELYDAYHLKDFDNAQSIVPAATLGRVDLTTGGWAAERGDRMGALLDLHTLTPRTSRTNHIAFSLLNVQAGAAGSFRNAASGENRGGWMVSGRRGFLDLAGRVLGQEDPSFWDALATAELGLGSGQTLTGRALVGDDRLRFEELVEGDFKSLETSYRTSYLWLTHRALVGSRTFVDSLVSWSHVEGDRRALEQEEEQDFRVADRRHFDVAEIRQGWSLEASERHLLSWGVGRRRYAPSYDYFNERLYRTPLAQIRSADGAGFRFRESLTGDHTEAYLTDRARLSRRLTAELGVRYDSSSWVDDHQTSPRLAVAYTLRSSTVVRASWGTFTQSQRPYELQVEDGDTRFYPTERSQQSVLGVEHVFGSGSGLALRVEAYRRSIDNPRPRYENIFQPYAPFPEMEPDRIRIEPQRSASQGVELFVRGPARGGIRWWVNYSLAEAEDRIADRWTPRQIDQTHTLNASVSVPLGRRFTLSTAWRYHTGWPTTPIAVASIPGPAPDEPSGEGENDMGSDVAVILGSLYSDRLSSYHRLDLRLSRELMVHRGRMHLFLDVQNVYDRKNVAGFDVQIEEDGPDLELVAERWPGVFPSVGISWEF